MLLAGLSWANASMLEGTHPKIVHSCLNSHPVRSLGVCVAWHAIWHSEADRACFGKLKSEIVMNALPYISLP